MPASPGVKCGFGLLCWLAKSLLCVCARVDMQVYLCFSVPAFLDNLVVFFAVCREVLEVIEAKWRE